MNHCYLRIDTNPTSRSEEHNFLPVCSDGSGVLYVGIADHLLIITWIFKGGKWMGGWEGSLSFYWWENYKASSFLLHYLCDNLEWQELLESIETSVHDTCAYIWAAILVVALKWHSILAPKLLSWPRQRDFPYSSCSYRGIWKMLNV